MTSIKVKFRPPRSAGLPGKICYRISCGGRSRHLSTDIRIYPHEWDERRSMVVACARGERRPVMLSIRERIRLDIEHLLRITRRLDSQRPEYSPDDVAEAFFNYNSQYTLFSFMEAIIVRLKRSNRIRTAETYKATLASFRKFRNDEDIMLDSISSRLMEDFEAWHRDRGLAPNTISFYMRILRAVYNRAVEDEIIENRYPFRKVYTGIDKTVKRALPLATVRRIKLLDLSLLPELDYARDMFILSFYLRGMSFVDMAYLKKSDLRDGYVVYRRRKTGQQLIIEWTDEMQTILDKYAENDSDYLLPIIRGTSANDRNTYRNVGYNINHNLKTIARHVGVSIPLTLYVARHSWASAARAKGIPISVISEGMGHDSETTTNIYLATLDTSVVDRANYVILKALR